MEGVDNMDSLDMNSFNDILKDLSEEEIESYENTPVDNKLITWAKENCKNNYRYYHGIS